MDPSEAMICFARVADTHDETQVAGGFGLAVTVSSALWAVQGLLCKVAALGLPIYDHLRRRQGTAPASASEPSYDNL